MGVRIDRINARKQKKKKILKTIVLFMVLGTFIIFINIIIAVKLFAKDANKNVAAAGENTYNSEIGDKRIDNNIPYEKDENADDVAFLENYLYQQELGVMPDGADGRKVVYLTFDDGPSTTVTPIILDILKKENVKATFFVIGSVVDSNEQTKELLKREVKEGHAIGNHTYSHDYNYLYPDGIINIENFMGEIEKVNKSFKDILGEDFSTRVIRFPGGYVSWKDDDDINSLLKEKGYYHIDWNSLSKDSEGGSKLADELIEEIKESVKGREKAIILMHDTYGKEETAKALPKIIAYLKENGYVFRTIK